METHIVLMIVTGLIISSSLFLIKNKTLKIIAGTFSWIILILYFAIERIVIYAAVNYSFLTQPMSDLGVTHCGTDTYVLAPYEICSPYHQLMNWTFFLTGLFIFLGAVLLHSVWSKSKSNTFATICISIFGISYLFSGLIPADVNLTWHTLSALPGMIVQLPAMIIAARSIYKTSYILFLWTLLCLIINFLSLILLSLQPIFENIPGGLFQRTLYGSVFLWLTVIGIYVLNRNQHQ